MKKICIFLLVLLCAELFGQGSASATKPDPSAAFQIETHHKGVILPRLTSKEIRGIKSPAQGLVVIDLDKRCLTIHFDGNWHCLPKGGGSWFSKDFYPIIVR